VIGFEMKTARGTFALLLAAAVGSLPAARLVAQDYPAWRKRLAAGKSARGK